MKLKKDQHILTNAIAPALAEKDGYSTDVWVVEDLGEYVKVRYGCWNDVCVIPKDSIKLESK